MITANEIRRQFIDFFVENGHSAERSSSLVPREDPTLLFTNAGMVQFKKVFLGQEKRPYSRAVTSQKCLRVGGKHNDLENVGRTARHHTFFEMLGNFSFGDYFKEEAIRLAWKFLTEVVKLPKDKLYVTIYKDDDEAGEIWRKLAGVPAERIFRLGDKDNFWSMGDTGPCGPCSEIIFDQGESMTCGPNCGIGRCDCDRFLEIWNLVFMQFDQLPSGERLPLPRPSIDTGMGLERITAVCQGVHSNFDIDLFQRIIGKAAELAGVKYGDSEEIDTALRVIADHSRAMTFLISEGILPSNEGRGYVLRRLIRRAYRFGRLIGLKESFLYQTALEVVACMGEAFPEIVKGQDFLSRVVREEEERFSDTLDKGLELLEEELKLLAAEKRAILPGDVAFKLYDTYGFPLDIINDVVEKQGVSVDESGYKKCMDEQKKRAKKAWKGSGEVDPAQHFLKLLESGIKSRFSGYDSLEDKGQVLALLGEGGGLVERLTQGHGGYVITDVTPFYGESGGQMGDKGSLETLTGLAEVLDTLKPGSELIAHKVFLNEGEILLEQEASLRVEEGQRLATARNHTATHLLHAALRRVLGEHVKQAGSLVGPERLRFDFTHISGLTPEELSAVEDDVTRAILLDAPVNWKITNREEATAAGAMALFGEKYGNEVRVVDIPGVSTELCGGTHLRATGQTGSFFILSESGVASGVRRIEAATGLNAFEFARANRAELEELSGLLRARPGELTPKLKALLAQVKGLSKDMETLSAKLASGRGADLMEGLREVGGVKLLSAKVEASDAKALRESLDNLRSRLASGVICLAALGEDNKVMLILSVSQDLHGRFTAPKLIKDVAAPIGGTGGGRPDMAQAGGNKPEGLQESFAKLEALLAG